MKKIVLFVGVSVLLLLSACSKDYRTGEASVEEIHAEAPAEGMEGVLSVELTVPAMFFEGKETEEAIAEAKANGVKDITKNDDGSLTYKISKEKHEEMLAEMTTTITEQLREIEEGADFHSIEKVSSNKQFNAFTVEVQREKFENSLDGFALLAMGFSGMLYQAFDGKEEGEIDVQIDVADIRTGEVFDTIHYPEALEKS